MRVLTNIIGFSAGIFIAPTSQNYINRKTRPSKRKYNGFMARPTKYSKETADGIVELIKQGYNLRASAQANGVSEASISRWRERYADFNKAVVLATKEQNDKVCYLSGIRPYRRKAYISPYYSAKPIVKSQARPEEERVRWQPKKWLGLPIKPRPLENEPTDPYLNPNAKCVEWIDKSGVFHTCPMWLWEEKHQPRPRYEDILDCFF